MKLTLSHLVSSQVLYNKSKPADDVASYEQSQSKATFGATFKVMNAYATAPLFMSVGDTLFGEDGETVDGTNWGNDVVYQFFNGLLIKIKQRFR